MNDFFIEKGCRLNSITLRPSIKQCSRNGQNLLNCIMETLKQFPRKHNLCSEVASLNKLRLLKLSMLFT